MSWKKIFANEVEDWLDKDVSDDLYKNHKYNFEGIAVVIVTNPFEVQDNEGKPVRLETGDIVEITKLWPDFYEMREQHNTSTLYGDFKEVDTNTKLYVKENKMNWRKVLANIDPPKGFIPTNEGMFLPEDLVDELTYRSYAHNRGLGVTPEGWKKMMNYGANFPETIERNNAIVDAMEKRYLNETQPERN